MKIEQKLAALGIDLPAPTIPATAPLRAWVVTGNLLYLSGAGPRMADGSVPKGKLGREFTTAQGREFARRTAINLLGAAKDALGDLDRVVRTVKLLGMVNCTEDFTEQPQVVNGCSELFVELWGENGRHARSAVGLQQLPGGMPVEIEAIFEIKPARSRRPQHLSE
ncbi:MAG: RidA family protein [Actinobacteria bacterium]|nr:RidA family protein [Actinomycetota bacterium]